MEPEDDKGSMSGEWNLQSLAIILFTYIAFALPWFVNEVLGLYVDTNHMVQTVSLLCYGLNFYIPSAVFSFMRYKEFQVTRRNVTACSNSVLCLEERYRMRRLYSVGSRPNPDFLIRKVTLNRAPTDEPISEQYSENNSFLKSENRDRFCFS